MDFGVIGAVGKENGKSERRQTGRLCCCWN